MSAVAKIPGRMSVAEFFCLDAANCRSLAARRWRAGSDGTGKILVLNTAKMLLRRAKDGNWPPQPLAIETGDLTLESIGLSIPLAAAYRTARLAPKK
jgi:hypothetical protein